MLVLFIANGYILNEHINSFLSALFTDDMHEDRVLSLLVDFFMVFVDIYLFGEFYHL